MAVDEPVEPVVVAVTLQSCAKDILAFKCVVEMTRSHFSMFAIVIFSHYYIITTRPQDTRVDVRGVCDHVLRLCVSLGNAGADSGVGADR